MANANRPYGLRPVGTMGHASYSGKVRQFCVPADNATAIFIGDPVMLASSSDAMSVNADDALYPEVSIWTASNAITCGVCVGIVPAYTDLSINYRKASTLMYVLVDTDPNTIYSVQGDSGAWTVADIGLNANITNTAGSTTTGISKMVITTPTADAAKDTLIVGVDPDPDNAVGVYWKMLVKLNLHQFGPGVVRLGIS